MAQIQKSLILQACLFNLWIWSGFTITMFMSVNQSQVFFFLYFLPLYELAGLLRIHLSSCQTDYKLRI